VDRASISTGATITVVSGSWENLPHKITPATARDEKEAIEAIFDELRTNMAINLEPNPTVDHWPPALVKPADGGWPRREYLLVGSSHAGKIALALRNMGHHTELIYETSWRANRERVLNLVKMANDKLQEVKIDAVIFCVMDNNVYYGSTMRGKPASPRRTRRATTMSKGI
jgi:hypothetical protein